MIGTVRTMATLDALVAQRRTAADLDRRLAQASQEVTTGMKADVYRALGLRSSETLALRARMERNDTFIESNEMLANRLDLTALSLRQIRETAQGLLDLAVTNVATVTQTAGEMQRAAAMALERLTGQINATFRGVPLFSGTDSGTAPLQGWDAPHPATGLAPRDILAAVIGPGIGDAADAAAKIATLQDVYASAATVPADWRFEASFFNGTPRLNPDGTPAPRVTARIDEEGTLAHGVQANDRGFTELLRGVAMLAATDASQIADPAAYSAWVSAAADALSSGLTGVLDSEARLGGQQQALDRTLQLQRDRSDLYRRQVLTLEGVDPYAAATRLTELQTQLEATYAVTARLSRLSFLNFL